MSHSIKTLVFVLCMSGLAVSCMKINTDYDLDKPIDMTVNVGGDLGMCVGSTEFIKIGDILPAEDMGLTVSPSGDYSISYSKDLSWSMSIPEFEIDADAGFTGNLTADVIVPAGSFDIPSVPFNIDNIICFFQDGIAEQISEIMEIKGDLTLSVNMSLYQEPAAFSSASLVKGTEYILPECMHIKSVSDNSVDIKDGHILVFNSDIVIPADGAPYAITLSIDSIDFTKLPEGQGIMSPGHIYLGLPLLFKGDLKFNRNDLLSSETLMTEIDLRFGMESSSIKVSEISGKVSISENIEIEPLEIDFDTDIIDIENACLDFADPRIEVQAANSFPVGADANIRVTSYADGNKVSTLALGSRNGTAAVSVPASGSAKYWLSPIADNPDGYTHIRTEHLSSLFNPFPDMVCFEEICVESSDNVVTFVPGDDYSVDFHVNLDMPMAFGENLFIPAEFSIDEMIELDGISFTHADITAEIFNSIPLGLEITAVLQDSHGNIQRDVELNLDCNVAPGSIENPSSSAFKLELKSDKPIESLAGLKLQVALTSSDPAFAGTRLNENQGIKLDDVKLHVYDGITIDLND